MSKEIIKDGTLFKQRNTPDWQEGYDQGLLAGYARSIGLIRHLQMSDARSRSFKEVREILEQAMDLIAEKIETNNNE